MLRLLFPLVLFAFPALAQDNDWETFEVWREGCPNPDFPTSEEERNFCKGFNYAMYFMSLDQPETVGDLTYSDGYIITGDDGGVFGHVTGPHGDVLMTSPDAGTTLADPASILGGAKEEVANGAAAAGQ